MGVRLVEGQIMADQLYVRRFGTSGDDTIGGGGTADLVYGFAGKDTLNGYGGDDRLRGGEGDDTLDGGTGHDVLLGETGNDRLIGGTGGDSMTGGAGLDTFVFKLAQQSGSSAGRDQIMDFEVSVDRIEFSGTGVDSMGDVKIQSIYGGTQVLFENTAGQTEVISLWGVSPHQLGEEAFIFS